MALRHIKDEDGNVVKAGDVVRFSYGIPPVGVRAKVVWNGHDWIVLTPGHNPDSARLRDLRKFVGEFWREDRK